MFIVLKFKINYTRGNKMNDVLKKAREVYFNLRYIERITDYSQLSQYENKMNKLNKNSLSSFKCSSINIGAV